MRFTLEEQDMLDQFVQWGESRASVRAMLLTSSRTSPVGVVDLFSDYDLILVVENIMPFFETRDWLEDFGPLLTLYRDPIQMQDGLEMSAYIVQYENSLKIDFTLWPVAYLQRIVADPQIPEEFDAGYRVLLDKDHLTDGLQPPTYQGYIPTPPTETQYREAVEGFFLDAIYTAKYLWRDDLMATKHLLDHFIKQEHLLPMLVWRSEIDHQWSVKPGKFGQRLKRWLRPDLWADLESTFTGPAPDANWDALFKTVALYRRVAIEVGGHLGYTYPHDLDRRASAYLQKVQHLDRQAERFE